MNSVIRPNWPAPKNIVAGTTTKLLVSVDTLELPEIPVLPKQVHGSRVMNILELNHENKTHDADAIISNDVNRVCAVETADCLPILMCDTQGTWVAAVHAGWKGIRAGVIESSLNALKVSRENLLIWIGPSISKAYYEVGEDMRSQFSDHQDNNAFEPVPGKQDKYLCDLSVLARNRLYLSNIESEQIYGDRYCTYSQPELFYSYRRDGAQKNRLMSFIWRRGN